MKQEIVFIPHNAGLLLEHSLGFGDRYVHYTNENDRLIIAPNGDSQLFKKESIIVELQLHDVVKVATKSHDYTFPRNGQPMRVKVKKEWL